jgi:HEAT repeat protein
MGALLNLGFLLHGRRQLARLLAGRRPVCDSALERFTLDLAGDGVVLRQSPACPVPMAYGRTEIVVPERFFLDLEREEQRAAIAHEAAHLIRRDPAWLLATRVVMAVFFFQPLNRLGGRRMRIAAEYLCDEWAAERAGRLALARCLLEVGGWLRTRRALLPAGACPMACSSSSIARRIERLTENGLPSRRPARRWFAITLVAFGGVAPAVRFEGEAGIPSSAAVDRPVGADSLVVLWNQAVERAVGRGESSFWVGYAFTTPIHSGDLLFTDSRGETFVARPGEIRVAGRTLAERLAAPADNGIAVLARFRGGAAPVIERFVYRSTALDFDFGGTAVHWIGTAASDESFTLVADLIEARPRDEVGVVEVELASLHPETERVLAALERWSRRGTAAIRREAAEGFNHHPDPRGVDLLEELALSDPAADVRAEAAETIGEVQDPSAVAAILRLTLDAAEPTVRREAAEGLAYQPPQRALPALRRLLAESADRQVLEAVVAATGEMPLEDAIGILEPVAGTSASPQIRRAAVHVTGYLATREGGAAILDRVERTLRSAIFADADPEVRREAVERVADLPAPRRARLLALISRSHPDPGIRELAGHIAREGG